MCSKLKLYIYSIFCHYLTLCNFQDKVLDICKNSRGVDASIFQAPGKLHLTLGTMVIMDNDEREEAVQTLAECKESIIE